MSPQLFSAFSLKHNLTEPQALFTFNIHCLLDSGVSVLVPSKFCSALRGNMGPLTTQTQTHTHKWPYVEGDNSAEWEAEQTDEVREKQPGQMCEY